jgi:hypothetical protein
VEQRLTTLVERLTPYVGPEKAEASLGAFRDLPGVGTPAQIVDKLSALKEQGLSYGIFYFPEAAYDLSGIELFEKEVLPALA